MNTENKNDLVYSKSVLEFVTVAREYCVLVESPGKYKTADLVNVTRKILAFLYLKASMLPDFEPVLDDELEKYVTELEYNILLDKWLQKLAGYDLYHEVFDPDIQFGTEKVTASISEGVLDIYQALKECTTSFSLGNEEVMNDALAECTSHFRDFWGQRLVNVLRALHQLYSAGIEWDKD